MSTPRRIQRKRTKGWRMPEGAVYVGRPSRWGNPFRVGPRLQDYRAGEAIRLFRIYAEQHPPSWFEPLRGRDLACWCPTSDDFRRTHAIGTWPCHADVLLELANA